MFLKKFAPLTEHLEALELCQLVVEDLEHLESVLDPIGELTLSQGAKDAPQRKAAQSDGRVQGGESGDRRRGLGVAGELVKSHVGYGGDADPRAQRQGHAVSGGDGDLAAALHQDEPGESVALQVQPDVVAAAHGLESAHVHALRGDKCSM